MLAFFLSPVIFVLTGFSFYVLDPISLFPILLPSTVGRIVSSFSIYSLVSHCHSLTLSFTGNHSSLSSYLFLNFVLLTKGSNIGWLCLTHTSLHQITGSGQEEGREGVTTEIIAEPRRTVVETREISSSKTGCDKTRTIEAFDDW